MGWVGRASQRDDLVSVPSADLCVSVVALGMGGWNGTECASGWYAHPPGRNALPATRDDPREILIAGTARSGTLHA